MQLICPNCNNIIDPLEVNVQKDLARCTNCNTLHTISELRKSTLENPITNLPENTKMDIRKGIGDNVEIHLPKRGLGAIHIPLILFTTFWLSFVAVWTYFAWYGSPLFAIFSIPFWFIGFAMLRGLVNTIWERQTLSVNRHEITLQKYRPINSRTYVFNLEEINSVEMIEPNRNPMKVYGSIRFVKKIKESNLNIALVPALVKEPKPVYFFESAETADQIWVCKTIDAVLRKKKEGISM